jgi:tRNA1Val (adenine37-N6)-methyltransferase
VFHFKQFSVRHDRCAMKIGTDAILLGVWAEVPKEGRILDVGTGTGVIALMMAQRTPGAMIDAIEIDEAAASQAAENFAASLWKDRLSVYHTSLQNYKPTRKYDLIISNPPFFEKPQQAATTSRSIARHMDTLSINELISISASMLSETGSLAIIIPAWEGKEALTIAEKVGLLPHSITIVKGTADALAKRWLLQMGREPQVLVKDELVIEIARYEYTEKYRELTREFYLRM